MSRVPELSYERIISALRRDGWIVIRSKGSHRHLVKRIGDQEWKLMIPAHRPVKRTTLAKALRQARIDLDSFLGLL